MPFWKRRREAGGAGAPAAPADDFERLGLSLEGARPSWVADQQTSRANVRRPEDPIVRPNVAAARAAQQAARESVAAPPWLAELPPDTRKWSPQEHAARIDLANVVEARRRRTPRPRQRGWFEKLLGVAGTVAQQPAAPSTEVPPAAPAAPAAFDAAAPPAPPAAPPAPTVAGPAVLPAPPPPAPAAPTVPPPSRPANVAPPAPPPAVAPPAPPPRAAAPPPPAAPAAPAAPAPAPRPPAAAPQPPPPAAAPAAAAPQPPPPAAAPAAAAPPTAPPQPPPPAAAPAAAAPPTAPPPAPPAAPVPAPAPPPAPPAARARPAAPPPPPPAQPPLAPAAPPPPPPPAQPLPAPAPAPVVAEAPAPPPPGPVEEAWPMPPPPAPVEPKVSVRQRIAERLAEQAERRRAQKESEEKAQRDAVLASIRQMSWIAYGALILDLFKRDDYITLLMPEDQPSVGDLWAERGEDRVLVQYRLRDEEVIPGIYVSELASEARAQGGTGAWMFTAGVFSEEAVELAAGYGVTLVDGETLAELVVEITVNDWKQQKSLGRRLGGIFNRGSRAA